MFIRVMPDLEMARDIPVLTGHLHCPEIFSILDRFDMRNDAWRQEAKKPVPVEGRTIVKAEGKFRKVLRRFFFQLFAKLGWRQAIALFQQCIEAAQAFEAAGVGDGGDRHGGIGEKLLRQQQALGLRKFNRGNAKFIVKDATHLAIGDAELCGQFGQRMFGQEILADMIRSGAGLLAADFHKTVAGGEFRATTLAGAIAGDLRGGGVAEKFAVFPHRRFDPANRAAVNARGFDRHEKTSVKAVVPREHGLVALFRI